MFSERINTRLTVKGQSKSIMTTHSPTNAGWTRPLLLGVVTLLAIASSIGIYLGNTHSGRPVTDTISVKKSLVNLPNTSSTTSSIPPISTAGGYQEFDLVQGYLQKYFPLDYGGIFATSETAMTISEVHHNAALEEAARSGLVGISVSFKIVPYSYAYLNALAAQIEASKQSLAAQGILISGAGGVNPEYNYVTVDTTPAELSKVSTYFSTKYKKGLVVVVAITAWSAVRPMPNAR